MTADDPDKRAPRVLHVITSTQRRGAESFAMSLCAELARRGQDGNVVALQRAPRPPEHDVPALGASSFHPSTLAGLRRAGSDADVVVAHGSRTLPASVLAFVGAGVPIIYVNIGDPLFWANSVARRARVRLLLGRVSAVAALTESSRAVLVDHFGMAGEDVRVIPNGRHAGQFPPADGERRRAARAELGLRADGEIVLYLGALSAEKRPDVAIDAVARMDGHAQLVFAGDGPLRAEMERRASDALGDRAVFLGARSDAARILTAADVLVLTSDSEGLPGVLIEAGLVGLPVVATDVGYVREVVCHDRTGVLVPPGDVEALASGLRTALDRRAGMAAAARVHCLEHFEMERIVDAWQHMLDGVCSTSRD